MVDRSSRSLGGPLLAMLVVGGMSGSDIPQDAARIVGVSTRSVAEAARDLACSQTVEASAGISGDGAHRLGASDIDQLRRRLADVESARDDLLRSIRLRSARGDAAAERPAG